MPKVAAIGLLWMAVLAGACRGPGSDSSSELQPDCRLVAPSIARDAPPPSGPRFVGLAAADGAAAGRAFATLRAAFVANNPGYDLEWCAGVRALPAVGARVAFVQGPATRSPAPTVGDVLVLRAGEAFTLPEPAAGALDLLVFTLPADAQLPPELPQTVRPDWDARITDTPGGCATEGDAYRRILLTWRPEVGPYVLHALNAHRVRIRDSFTHYHPAAGGFDEFYLVQQAPPAAALLTSTAVAAIEAERVDRDAARTLFTRHELHAGDLVYLPRGTAHRGLGGALVQVISVPGFVPDTEIGLDRHLWAINLALGLTGDDAIPFHLVAARTAK